MFLGDILRQSRINLGISQKEMADTLGVTYSFLCKVEKNEKKISLEKLQVNALKYPVEKAKGSSKKYNEL
ncbi:helix-turn-helix domain-containing protein [Kaistella rhinocerotis]|uniref:helix-turn-helix domain-containing protein n=1 Tax=Kaistella rhinocerotis TaxID=3026437 RepID=UPI0025553352|nr:helix-turn-helix transcriptional regulator [Kaistella sp. Ran72]